MMSTEHRHLLVAIQEIFIIHSAKGTWSCYYYRIQGPKLLKKDSEVGMLLTGTSEQSTETSCM